MKKIVDTSYNQILENADLSSHKISDPYIKQMAENHAFLIDKNFWMVVKQKPKWLPAWLYKKVIKNLIEFQQYK